MCTVQSSCPELRLWVVEMVNHRMTVKLPVYHRCSEGYSAQGQRWSLSGGGGEATRMPQRRLGWSWWQEGAPFPRPHLRSRGFPRQKGFSCTEMKV